MISRTALKFYVALALFSIHTFANTAPLSLSKTPLYLGGGVEPNIMFILDDSGSMVFEVTPDDLAFPGSSYSAMLFPSPDSVYGSGTPYPSYSKSLLQVVTVDDNNAYNATSRSPQFNSTYYDPSVTYRPWVKEDKSLYPDADPDCAWHNPENTGSCPYGDVNSVARDLTTSNDRYNSNRWRDCDSGGSCSSSTSNKSFWPATYFWHNGGAQWSWNNYTRVEIRSSTPNYSGHNRSQRDDCGGDGICSYDQEIQNFANWYTYYRSRILTARASIGRAFVDQSKKRIGYATINKGSSDVDDVSTGTIIDGVRDFDTSRGDFFDNLYGRDIPPSGTPLREALDDVGQYFSRTDEKGPWSSTPGQSGGTDYTCRLNYSIMMTDGYWSGGSSYDADTSAARANVDNAAGLEITGPENPSFEYTPIGPFRDSQSNTLADVAMYYWKRDLRTDLENDVATSPLDPAFWQHMSTFGISFGLTGSINADDAWNAIDTETDISWPDTNPSSSGNCSGSDCPARLDDLLHASVNSRGGFFNASNPKDLADAIADVLASISKRQSSASSVALNTGTISTNSLVYQAKFNSEDWSGQLLAYNVDSDGALSSTASWNAGDLIPAHGSRKIFTYDGNAGLEFSTFTALSTAQQASLGSQSVLNYLRGDDSNELSNGGSFRNRNTLLGDIIHSSPAYVSMPLQRYPDIWESGAPGVAENAVSAERYSTFKLNNQSRQAVVYVGANDGMLHAFNAETGVELFSYVPESVYHNLSDLTVSGYNHEYYVDESPTIVDVFIAGSWKTVLVSGLGAGGQGIFALDVTDPENFDENDVLWEYTDSDNSDLGYTFGKPSIVRMHDGSWAAIFSGGYNNTADNAGDGATADSTTGNAKLYIVDLASGGLLTTLPLDTQKGTAQDPSGQNRPNGLATPAVVDIDDDAIADFIYAGDLFGNMWKIDITSDNPNQWDFAMKDAGKPQPLYTACSSTPCSTTNSQPITTQPQIINHPTGNGYLVLFGTGKYFEVGDNSDTNQTTQSFYGLWDKDLNSFSTFDKTNLLQQSITNELIQSGFELRVTSENTIDWSTHMGWYIDLIDPDTAANHGERQVSEAIVRNGRVIFTTLLPSEDPCGDGGTSWLMELDVNSGSRLPYSPFDIDGDKHFTENDYVNLGDIDGDGEDDYVPASGKKSKVGITDTPGIVNDDDGQREFKYSSGSSGEIEI
ncbi:pilus assembly protein, partial [Methylophaga sp.]|uniref:pilus assembly protein n=1 Tax=Methylophaga sp. TaxID=2024840 RepID=UPI003F69734D